MTAGRARRANKDTLRKQRRKVKGHLFSLNYALCSVHFDTLDRPQLMDDFEVLYPE